MNRILSTDSPIFRFLTAFADLMAVNLLMILFSLPMITAGAAIVAGCRVTRDVMNDQACHIVQSFWKAFRENWKQATVVWIGNVLVVVGLIWNIYLFQGLFDAESYRYAVITLLLLLAFTVGFCGYSYFLISRYENRIDMHLKNAMALFFHYLPRSVAMVLLNGFPFALFLLSPFVFLQTFVVWVGFGFALILYLDNLMMKRVFRELEGTKALKEG